MPALAGMAASVCLAPQALADQARASVAAHSAATADSLSHAGMAPAELLLAVRQAAAGAGAGTGPDGQLHRQGG